MRSLPILPFLLLLAIFLGGLWGYFYPLLSLPLKPLGELFLNLIFTFIIPLLFFSIAASFTRLSLLHKIKTTTAALIVGFIFLSLLAASFMYGVLYYFPLIIYQNGVSYHIPAYAAHSILETLVKTLTVHDFYLLFSRDHLLALIIFSALIGIASGQQSFAKINIIFEWGSQLSLKLLNWTMYYAPIGLFAYMAVIIATMPKLISQYLHNLLIYYLAGSLYGVMVFSLLILLIIDKRHLIKFWRVNLLPLLIGFGSLSSAAALPSNMFAAKKLGVPQDIYETVLPIGTLLHKQGTILGAMLKIAFLFSWYHWNLFTVSSFFGASFVAILAGSVMGAVPGGGMLAELLIVSLYHFPKEALPMIIVIGILIDPLATVLNVLGNNVYALIVTWLLHGKKYLVVAS